jgi:beta-glucosidase
MSSELGAAFPPDFLWGAATASYQIEGAPHADGKGESIWDRFSHTPGKVRNGDTGDVACDHYHRWREDIALMRELGLDAYRFSVAWPRVQPTGRGPANAAGLDFYDRLVDGLLEAQIQPFVTLYHWDLPQALQDEGGWANRATAEAFADYAEIVARRLGDRVSAWITHNEPWVAAFLGNLIGEHAPGLTDMATAVAASHHLLLSHGLAVPRIRAAAPGAQVGITLSLSHAQPATDSPAGAAAAHRSEGFGARWFLDPLAGRGYPTDTLALFAPAAPPVQPGDLETIAAPIDFLGVNNYFRNVVRDSPENPPLNTSQVHPDGEYTTMDWEVYPDGLRALLEWLHQNYPFTQYYIAENGAAFPDMLEPDGSVHDERRQAYLEGYLAAAAEAIAHGVPLVGYFVWSLLDNFEWAHGYSQRFGIFYVDFPTGRRIWKDSARWYQRFIAEQHGARAAAGRA